MNRFQWQRVILVSGTVFAFLTVVQDFLRFYELEGTLFRVQDCAIPNPVTTPCFWGAWAFLSAAVWAFIIYTKHGEEKKKQQKRLLVLLVAGTLFAWFNNTRELIKFYSNTGEATIGCSGQLVTNPYITPCFIGASLFLLALLIGFAAYRSLKSNPVKL